jgi:hypothetical protein
MLKRTAIVLLLLAAACLAAGVAGSHLLDGKTYVGDSSQKGKEEKQKDTLIFEKGTFRSTACDQYGFTAAPYTAKKEGGVITFTADSTSEKEGKNHWEGTVTDNSVQATLTWTKEGQAPIEYTFTGTLKK